MRIAFFSPLPPLRSGIAEYSSKLLPYLDQQAEITLFVDEAAKVDPTLQQAFLIRDLHSFTGPLAEGFNICLYQMGNNLDDTHRTKLTRLNA